MKQGKLLTEFCQENTLVIANSLFQQHKRRLYTWVSPDGLHRNQIIFFAAKDGEALYSQQKQDLELTVAQIMMEKAMAPHSSTLAWKIPWMEEPGRLQSMRSLGVGHDEQFHFHFSLSCIGEGNGNPLQCSCLENPRGGGAWWAALYGVAESRTRLK